MKKRIVCILLAMAIALCSFGFVQAKDSADAVELTRGALTLSGGLRNVSGRTYTLWATVTASTTENLYVRARLYRVENGAEILVKTVSYSATATSCTASGSVTVPTGYAYVVKLYASGNTTSVSATKNYSFITS